MVIIIILQSSVKKTPHNILPLMNVEFVLKIHKVSRKIFVLLIYIDRTDSRYHYYYNENIIQG